MLRNMVKYSIEKTLRLQVKIGTAGVKKLLDLIGDKFGASVARIVDMVKDLLEDFSKLDAMIERIMEKIKKPLSYIFPSMLRNMVKYSIEKTLRLQVKIGTAGVKKLLDLIG